MPFNGIAWQSLQLPLAAGLYQKADDRARPQPYLDICRDVQFDDAGGLQTRYPYAAAAGDIFGGGTIANPRRIVANGSELLLFTSDSLYSWNATLSKWVLRATHLAVAVDESPMFATPGDQIDGDRAELAGTVVCAWTEATTVYAAAFDKVTKAVLVAPTAVSTAVGRPRLVALATKILLFVDAGSNNLTVRAIDPSAPGTAIAGAGTSVAAGTLNTFYDVVKVEGQDLCAGAHLLSPSSSYRVFKVTAGLVVTGATKARACNSPIAIVSTPGSGTQLQVIRPDLTNILGDLLTTSSLADVFTNQAIGTAASSTINQVTVAYSSTTTAVAFWTSGSTGETATFADFTVKKNTVTTSNVVGTQATFRHQLGIASRAFTYASHAYLWLAFASDSGTSALGNTTAVRAQLQHTYFLFRDDGLLVSRCAAGNGGGFAPSTGRLPGVAAVGTLGTEFAWCATSRRIIDVGAQAEHTAFSARQPRDVVITFDSDAARRCARIGRTLYVSGGIPLQYDGVALTEVGFLIYPWYFEPQVGAAGNLGAGTYTWKSTMKWVNAQGEVERSTTATGMSLTIAASKFVFLNYLYLRVTLKTGARPPSIDMWRTAVAPGLDAPFFLVTSQDPNAGIVDNGYVANVDDGTGGPTPLPDNFADATLITKEISPENGSVLENLAPPGAKIIVATDTRVFLAGVAGDPDRVWYSKQRGDGEVAAFHDVLATDVPRDGGAITALAIYEETLFVFRATAIYALAGAGLDNFGQGQNFGPARIVSLDIGAVSHETVAITPVGLIFKSSKGWQLLTGAGQVQFIGDRVSDFDSETVLAVNVVETQHQVRILMSARMIVWDYRMGQWGEWTVSDGIHATMFGGAHVYLAATGTRTQGTTYTGLTYGMDIETSWIKPADLAADSLNNGLTGSQGSARVRKLQPLGEYRSDHRLRFRVAYNYLQSYVDDKLWTPTPTTVGGPLQVKHGPKRPQCDAIKLRLTAVAPGTAATLATEDLDPQVAVLGAGLVWTAGFLAAAPGDAGNALSMSVAFEEIAFAETFSIDVRDHFAWNIAAQIWTPAVNTIGVRVLCREGSTPTVGDLETAIAAGTALATIAFHDAGPSQGVDSVGMVGFTCTASFSGGAYGVPTGEALRLTGLGVDVGYEQGLFRRLPPGQQQ